MQQLHSLALTEKMKYASVNMPRPGMAKLAIHARAAAVLPTGSPL